MQVETELQNEVVQSKPWKGICCKRCWFAKTEPKKCKCRCHGENHQKGNKKLQDKDENLSEGEMENVSAST